MAIEPIDTALLRNVMGGAAEGGNRDAVLNAPRECTPHNPTGQAPQRYWQNAPAGSGHEPGHGGGGHNPHLDPPVHIRHPRPRLPPIVRSDRRLKRRIRSL